MSYCENNVDCRRVISLRYFGQEFDRTQCNKSCDNCESQSPGIYVNVTPYAQAIMRIVNELSKKRDTCKEELVEEIFRGSKAKRSQPYQKSGSHILHICTYYIDLSRFINDHCRLHDSYLLSSSHAILMFSLPDFGAGSKNWQKQDTLRLIRHMCTEDYLEEYSHVVNPHATYQVESYFLRPGHRSQDLLNGQVDEMGMTFKQKVNSQQSIANSTAAGIAATAIVPFMPTQPTNNASTYANTIPMTTTAHRLSHSGSNVNSNPSNDGMDKLNRAKIQPLALASANSTSSRSKAARVRSSSPRANSPIPPWKGRAVVYDIVDDDLAIDHVSVVAQPKIAKAKPIKKQTNEKDKEVSQQPTATSGGGPGNTADHPIDVIELSSDGDDAGDAETDDELQPLVQPQPSHMPTNPPKQPSATAPSRKKTPSKSSISSSSSGSSARGPLQLLFDNARQQQQQQQQSLAAAKSVRRLSSLSSGSPRMAKAQVIEPMTEEEEMQVDSIQVTQDTVNQDQDQFAPDDLVRGKERIIEQDDRIFGYDRCLIVYLMCSLGLPVFCYYFVRRGHQ